MKQIQPGIRLPENLYKQIKSLAKANNRSLNQQVIFMLAKQIESERTEDGYERPLGLDNVRS